MGWPSLISSGGPPNLFSEVAMKLILLAIVAIYLFIICKYGKPCE